MEIFHSKYILSRRSPSSEVSHNVSQIPTVPKRLPRDILQCIYTQHHQAPNDREQGRAIFVYISDALFTQERAG